MKLHLPHLLRKALLAAVAATFISAGTASANPITVKGSDSNTSFATHDNDGRDTETTTYSSSDYEAGDLSVTWGSYTFNGSDNQLKLDRVLANDGAVIDINNADLVAEGDVILNGDGSRTYVCNGWVNGVDDSSDTRPEGDADDHSSHTYTESREAKTAVDGNLISNAGDISINGNDTTVDGNMTATAGNITVSGDTTVTVGGNISAGDTITVNDGSLTTQSGTVKGNTLDVNGGTLSGQYVDATTALVDSGTLGSTGTEHITLTKADVSGGAIQGGTIHITNEATVDGGSINGTLLNINSAKVSGGAITGNHLNVATDLTISGTGNVNITAMEGVGDGLVEAGTINMTGGNLTGAGISTTGDMELAGTVTSNGNMTSANGDITISAPAAAGTTNVTVSGNQSADHGSITLSNANLTVTGSQNAHDNIKADGKDTHTVEVTGAATAGGYIDLDNLADGSSYGSLTANTAAADGNKIHITNSTLTVTGNVTAKNPDNNSTAANNIAIDGSSAVTVDGVISAANGKLEIGQTSTEAGPGADEKSTLHLTGTNIGAHESLIDEDICTVIVNAGDKIDADSMVSTFGTTAAGTKIGTNETIYGTVEGTVWNNTGKTTVDGIYGEGSLTVSESTTLTGQNTVQKAASIHATGEGGSITLDGTDVNGEQGHNTISGGSWLRTDGDGSSITLTGDDDVVNTVTQSTIVAAGTNSNVLLEGWENKLSESGVAATEDVSLFARSNSVQQSSISSTETDGDITLAGRDGATDAAVTNDLDNSVLSAKGGSVLLRAESNDVDNTTVAAGTNAELFGTTNAVTGGSITADKGDISIVGVAANTAQNNTIDSVNVTATEGSVLVKGETNTLTSDVVKAAESVQVLGENNTIQTNSSLTTTAENGSITLAGVDGSAATQNSITNTSLAATGNNSAITVNGATNTITNATIAASNVNDPEVKSGSGDVTITGTSSITNATIAAGDTTNVEAEGADDSRIVIQDAVGGSTITDATITSTGTVAITSETATADGATTITDTYGNNPWTLVTSYGVDEKGTGITFRNVNLYNLDVATGLKEIHAVEGDILIEGAFNQMTGTELSVDTEAKDASVRMAEGAVLKMHEKTHFDGKLSSVDGSALIEKDGGDTLTLDHSARRYEGTITLLADDGSDLVINHEGLGLGSVVKLRDTNLNVTKAAFSANEDGMVQFGTIDTTADEGSRAQAANDENHDGFADAQGQLLSYTQDDNDRALFRTEDIGSIISANAGNAGDTLRGTAMALSEHTLLRVDAAVNEAGDNAVLDTYALSGSVQGNNARVFVTAADEEAGINDVVFADQTAQSFITTAEGGSNTAFHEDVLFDVRDEVNGVKQRDMQNMNAWVRTTEQGAEIVYSRNFRSSEGKTLNQQTVAGALDALSRRHDQAEGDRQTSTNRFENLLDAFDYTRSGDDANRGLTSVSGVSNTIAQHSVMDSSRHHMDTLRRWITLPSCTVSQPEDGKGPLVVTQDTQSTVWATYTGGYDMIDEPSSEMGGYTRTYQGVQTGYSRQLSCSFLLGLGLGYENSVSRSTATHFHADSYFVDLYGSARTGRFNHRFSAGMGIHKFATDRHVYVHAPNGHSFSDTAYGDVEARSLNLSYELSRDFELTEASTLSPYLAVNYAYHAFNTLREGGMGSAGLITEYEDINQLELALGARYAYSFALVQHQAPATVFAAAELKAEFSDHEPTASNAFQEHEELKFRVKSLERSPFYGEIGAGLSVPFAERWSAHVSGSYEFGSDRNALNGGIGVQHQF